jgi:ubiquinone/menaquinone biosynthesis C-methylase UbiE
MASIVDARTHWDRIYSTKPATDVSRYRPHLERSLDLIDRAACDRNAAIIEVGGGASTLVDDLLDRGYTNITVMDVSGASVEAARQRLGQRAEAIEWVVADFRNAVLPSNAFDVWHDRAAFHFLVDVSERAQYVSQLRRALRPQGQAVIATFAPTGPTHCSGLEVVRYEPVALQESLGEGFHLVESDQERHVTPSGSLQPFSYCRFQRNECTPR